jgi:hypothetical protein
MTKIVSKSQAKRIAVQTKAKTVSEMIKDAAKESKEKKTTSEPVKDFTEAEKAECLERVEKLGGPFYVARWTASVVEEISYAVFLLSEKVKKVAGSETSAGNYMISLSLDGVWVESVRQTTVTITLSCPSAAQMEKTSYESRMDGFQKELEAGYLGTFAASISSKYENQKLKKEIAALKEEIRESKHYGGSPFHSFMPRT